MLGDGVRVGVGLADWEVLGVLETDGVVDGDLLGDGVDDTVGVVVGLRDDVGLALLDDDGDTVGEGLTDDEGLTEAVGDAVTDALGVAEVCTRMLSLIHSADRTVASLKAAGSQDRARHPAPGDRMTHCSISTLAGSAGSPPAQAKYCTSEFDMSAQRHGTPLAFARRPPIQQPLISEQTLLAVICSCSERTVANRAAGIPACAQSASLALRQLTGSGLRTSTMQVPRPRY